MDYLDIFHSPIEAAVWATYMERPAIVFPVVMAVAVFVIAITCIGRVTESIVRKRGQEASRGYAAIAMCVAIGVSLLLAIAAAYVAPVATGLSV